MRYSIGTILKHDSTEDDYNLRMEVIAINAHTYTLKTSWGLELKNLNDSALDNLDWKPVYHTAIKDDIEDLLK